MIVVKKRFALKVDGNVVNIAKGQYQNELDGLLNHEAFKLYVDGGYVELLDSHKNTKFTEEQEKYVNKLKKSKVKTLQPKFVQIKPGVNFAKKEDDAGAPKEDPIKFDLSQITAKQRDNLLGLLGQDVKQINAKDRILKLAELLVELEINISDCENVAELFTVIKEKQEAK